MKYILWVLAIVTISLVGYGGVVAAQDQIGVYFDTSAESVCLDVPSDALFNAYLILSNLTSSEVWGIGFRLQVEFPPENEGQIGRWALEWPPHAVQGDEGPTFPDSDHSIGLGLPLLASGGNAIFITWTFLVVDVFPVEFYLGPMESDVQGSGAPWYVGDNHEIVTLGVSSGSYGLPVAELNGECGVVGVQTSTFGRVKCLYR